MNHSNRNLTSVDEDALPVVHACDLEDPCPQRRWLVDRLWTRAGVGVIGGTPKLGKTSLGLDLAVSVASATPCLDTFDVHQPGPILLYMAEDAAPDVKARIKGLCDHRRLDLAALPIHVITVPTLRLDLAADQRRLHNTLAQLRPRLLLLDPFVRLHKINENDAREVSAILAYLRGLQRTFDLAVVVVHHSRKNTRIGAAGHNLRGSGDFHAWYDSSLHLHAHKNALVLTPEHRAAPPPGSMTLCLHADENTGETYFKLVQGPLTDHDTSSSLEADILAALAGQPLTREKLRTCLRVRNQTLGTALHRLAHSGRITRQDNQWRLAACPPPAPAGQAAEHAHPAIPVPNPTQHPERNGQTPHDQLPLNVQSF